MFESTKMLRALAAAAVLAMAAGCADKTAPAATAAPAYGGGSPPMAAAPGTAPELAGAWYQVFFDTNSAELNDRGKLVVKNVANVVATAGPTRVTVIGKTDRVGGAPANLALSERRANTVRDALVAGGVPANKIDTGWTGEYKQQVATVDDAAEARNRVVDITVIKQ